MKLLIVEDDQFKLGRLKGFLSELTREMAILEARSVASGKDLIRRETFDLVLLDMSLPSYDIDIEQHEPGGTPQIFGGRELLGYLDFRGLDVPVVVVTQFERFWTGYEEIDITNLGRLLKRDFSSNFREIIYFNTGSESWQTALQRIIELVGRG